MTSAITRPLTRPVTSPLTATLAAINDADFVPLGTERLFGDGSNVGKLDLYVELGQSNGFNGRFAANVDRVPNPKILKVPNTNGSTGYAGPYVGKLLYDVEPLEGINNGTWRIGHGRSFAENLLAQAPAEMGAGAKILMMRFNVGGTGFYNQTQPNWTPDAVNTLYNRATTAVLAVLDANPEIQLRGILWHQGEEDVGAVYLKFKSQTGNFTIGQTLTCAATGQQAIIMSIVDNGATGLVYIKSVIDDQPIDVFSDGDVITDGAGGAAIADGGNTTHSNADWLATITAFVARLRSDLKTPDLPFIVGGLSPDQASYNSRSAAIVALPDTLSWCGAADPRANGQSGYPGDTTSAAVGINDELPLGIPNDQVHFAASTQRANIGPRYTKGFLTSLTHNNPGGADNAYAVPDAIADLAATSNDTYVTLDFTVPDNNGAVIAGYDAQISPTGQNVWIDAPKRFCGKGRKLAGLANGVAIDIRVRARNKAGAGVWSNVVVNVTPGTVWQSEALSLFALMSSPPNDAMKLAINAFIRDTKADGSWATFDMVQCYALNAEQSCLLDWKTQGRTVAKVGSPVFTPKIGVKPSANTDRISTGFNPGDGGTYNLAQTSLMLCVVVNEESQNNNPDLGCTGSINLGIYARTTADVMRANLNDNSGTTTVPNTTSVGRFYATRFVGSNNTKHFYRNGAPLGTATASTSAVANAPLQALGHANTNSSLRQVAMVLAGSGLNDAAIATLDTRVAALLSALAMS